MAFREIKDIKKTTDYQRNLRAALAAAEDQVAEFVVWQAFPFAEQTAQMIVVAPTVDNSLIRKVAEQNAHKLGFGQCRVSGKKLYVKPGNSISESQISLAFKVAKIPMDVEVVARNVDLAAPPDQRAQTQAHGTPVANAAQEKAKNALAKDYPELIKRLEKASSDTRDMKERTALSQLQRKIGSEWDDKDYVAVQSLMGAVDKAVDAVEARIKERDKQQAACALVVKKLQDRYDTAQAAVPAPLFKKAMVAWGAAAQHAAKDEYGDAGKLLAAMPGLLDKAEDDAREAWRERLKQEREDAGSQLDSPSKGETALLKERGKAVEDVIATLEVPKIEAGLSAFGVAVKALVALRRQMHMAQTLFDKAQELWVDEQYNLGDKPQRKAKAAIEHAENQLNAAKAEAAPAQAAKLLKNVLSQSQLVLDTISTELQSRKDIAAKATAASQALKAAMDQSANEDAAATSHGNSTFSSGMLKDIWKAALNVHDDNPPNGSIAGVHSLATVEAAINTWRHSGNAGILTNFHVPGGRPQHKWEKNFIRAEIQANFCVKWRGNKINIHVDVDPRTYFDAYGDEVDWSQVPQSMRKAAGR